MGEWQDISTAPKDGTNILLTDGKSIMHSYWCGDKYGWRDVYEGYHRLAEPTHWTPEPTFPK